MQLYKYTKKYPVLLFISILLFIYMFLSFGKYLHYKPSSIHQWAQSDRASVALNYYQESMNFFIPRVHNISNGTGITGLEFPIINYTAAVLYKIFGFDEFWYRFLVLTIISIGLIFTFKFCNKFLNSTFLSIAITLLFYLSPTIVYYSANFIPDIPSLGFILIAWYFLFRYKENYKNNDLILFTLFASLSALIKITSLISIFTIIGVLLLDTLNFFDKKQFQNKSRIYFSLFLVLISVISWYTYSTYLNEKYQAWFFLMKIKPVEGFQDLMETIKFINYFWFDDYYDKSVLISTTIAFIYLLFNFNKGNKLLNTITLMLCIGDIGFFLLMLFQFRDHDYYIITLVVPILFLLLSVSIILKDKELNFNIISKVLLSILIISNLFYCKKINNNRYSYNISHDYFGNIEFYDKLKNIDSELRLKGISYFKIFTIMFDNAPNITLYTINQKGFVVQNSWNDTDLEKFLLKSDYVLIENEHIFDREMYKKYFYNKVLDKDGISVFKLK